MIAVNAPELDLGSGEGETRQEGCPIPRASSHGPSQCVAACSEKTSAPTKGPKELDVEVKKFALGVHVESSKDLKLLARQRSVKAEAEDDSSDTDDQAWCDDGPDCGELAISALCESTRELNILKTRASKAQEPNILKPRSSKASLVSVPVCTEDVQVQLPDMAFPEEGVVVGDKLSLPAVSAGSDSLMASPSCRKTVREKGSESPMQSPNASEGGRALCDKTASSTSKQSTSRQSTTAGGSEGETEDDRSPRGFKTQISRRLSSATCDRPFLRAAAKRGM